MVSECIHGFEGELCDSCFPKAMVERPKVVRQPSVPRRTAGATATKKPVNLADQRVYHVTHISNLDSILEAGALIAGATPALDVSSPLTRELRATAQVAPGVSVADFVPFYLAPNATLWQQLRNGSPDPRWSAAGREAAVGDFVFLVSTVRGLGSDPVMADGDAAATYTRFAATSDDTDRMLRRLHDDEPARLDAEALAPGSFPFDAVQLIGVANDPMRERVKQLLDAAHFPTKVAVYPPWFQQA